ncbi:MAG: methyltransferase domain-containing protein [Nitrospira sp.]
MIEIAMPNRNMTTPPSASSKRCGARVISRPAVPTKSIAWSKASTRQDDPRHRLRLRRDHAASGRAPGRPSIGFDVEKPVMDGQARADHKAGAAPASSRRRPGGCLTDASFDVVFSKDALLQADKDALFAEIFRVLKPGGVFAASNWMIGHDGEPSPRRRPMSRPRNSPSPWLRRRAMRKRCAAPASPRSRCAIAIHGTARSRGRKSARLKGPLYAQAAAAVGAAYVDKNIKTWEAMQKVLDSGEHRPTHLRGWKPVG